MARLFLKAGRCAEPHQAPSLGLTRGEEPCGISLNAFVGQEVVTQEERRPAPCFLRGGRGQPPGWVKGGDGAGTLRSVTLVRAQAPHL